MFPINVEESSQEPRVLTFYEDPGHGWVAVPHSMVKDLGIADKISDCSYVDDTFAYLEEDCDLSVLVEAIKAQGQSLMLDEQHTDNDSPIRDKRRFSVEALETEDRLLELTVLIDLTFIDTDGKEKVTDGKFSWTVVSGKAASEVEMNLRTQVEREQEYGFLNDKKPVQASVAQVFVNRSDRGGALIQRYSLPGIEVKF